MLAAGAGRRTSDRRTPPEKGRTVDLIFPNLNNAGWQKWGRNATSQISENASGLGITPAAAAAAQAAFDAYSRAYDAAVEPLTRSTPRVRAKNDALAAFKTAIRPVVATIQANGLVTNEQRAELGLGVRDRKATAATVPAMPPSVVASLTGPQSLRAIASDPLDPHRRGRPAGIKSLAVHVCFGQTAPGGVGQWPLYTLSGRTTVDLVWPDLAADATVWISCCWVSTRNECGGFSQPISVRLPGNGMMPAADEASDEGGMKIAA